MGLLLLTLTGCYWIPKPGQATDTGRGEDSVEGVDSQGDSVADTDTEDADGDGYSPATGDCDDQDPAVNPGESEVCRDGLDNNCDGGADGCVLGDVELDDADGELTGEGANSYAGNSVAGAGDVDADGYPDILVGAFGDTAGGVNAGAAYLLLGGATIPSGSLSDADAKYSGGAGEIVGGDADGLASAGDVNGDGYADVLIGATGNGGAGQYAGLTYLVLGGPRPLSAPLSECADATFSGEAANDYAGGSVAGAGDVNGDGFEDMVIAASGNDEGGSDAGAAYLVLGSTSQVSDSLRGADAKFTGEAANDFAGNAVAGVGDVDGDGLSDLLVGAPQNSDDGYFSGTSYLLLGAASMGSRSLALADARLTGEADSDLAGQSVAAAGDVNGDGLRDVIIGAFNNQDGGPHAGAAYLVLGSTTPQSQSLSDATARYTGEANEAAGMPVGGAGDTDGDGFDDLLVVGPYVGGNSGVVHLVFGGSAPASLSLSDAPTRLAGGDGEHAGASVAGAGDVDRDGYADVLVGAIFNYDAGKLAGAAFIVRGLGP